MKEHRVSVTRAEAYFRLLAVKAKSYPYAPSLSERTFMATTILCSDGMRRKSRSTCKRARAPSNHTSSARALGNPQSRRPHTRTPARTTHVRGTHRTHPAQTPRAHTAHTRVFARPQAHPEDPGEAQLAQAGRVAEGEGRQGRGHDERVEPARGIARSGDARARTRGRATDSPRTASRARTKPPTRKPHATRCLMQASWSPPGPGQIRERGRTKREERLGEPGAGESLA